MYRRVVLYNSNWTSSDFRILYHVRGARLLSQHRASTRGYEQNMPTSNEMYAVVFADSILLGANTGVGFYRTYEFVLDVPENQPVGESVEEISETGSAVIVFNENGVVVCRNGVEPPAETVGRGQMASEPIGAPGEMTSEPIGV